MTKSKEKPIRQSIVMANWKMYKTVAEAETFLYNVKAEVVGIKDVEMVICPPFTALESLHRLMEESNLILGAQNMHWGKEGAFTGEISPLMLKESGVTYVIIGHSERRNYFGENNDIVAQKVFAAVEAGLLPILCVGEDREQRRAGDTEEVVKEQLLIALDGLKASRDTLKKIIVAYEPVWAIGSGAAAYPEDVTSVAVFIRSLLQEKWGEISQQIRIAYGGSVKPDNISDFTSREDIDGALVGGSSLKETVFVELVEAVRGERRV